MRHHNHQATQLPLPLIQVLPYMGDNVSCHYWDMTEVLHEPDPVRFHDVNLLTREWDVEHKLSAVV